MKPICSGKTSIPENLFLSRQKMLRQTYYHGPKYVAQEQSR